ncbi:MAG: hypothetical protein BJ554DRAFT_4813, partial [Olpidium bornovanus]
MRDVKRAPALRALQSKACPEKAQLTIARLRAARCAPPTTASTPTAAAREVSVAPFRTSEVSGQLDRALARCETRRFNTPPDTTKIATEISNLNKNLARVRIFSMSTF